MKNCIEENRCFSIIKRDSFNDPEKIIPSLKSEIKQIAEDYLVLSGEVKLRYRLTSDGYVFMAEIPASSIKNLFYF